MGRKRKKSQHHKFKKLRNKRKAKYALLRKDYTINPELIMKKVWERLGKSLDQRMLHDVYKVIDEFLLEKILYDGIFELEGFGTLQLVEKSYTQSESSSKLELFFIPDLKLKDKNDLLKKEK